MSLMDFGESGLVVTGALDVVGWLSPGSAFGVAMLVKELRQRDLFLLVCTFVTDTVVLGLNLGFDRYDRGSGYKSSRL